MASTVSDLTSLAAGDVAQDDDLLYIVDVSAGTAGSKKITVTALLAGRSFTNVVVGDTYSLLVGGATAQVISDGDGGTNLTPTAQVLGTAKADSSLLLASFNTTNDATVAPSLNFLKSGNAAIGSKTVVASGEVLGEITAFGDDGTDYESPAARIQFVVDNTPGAGDMPGLIVFSTTADGGETLAERLRINSTGDTLVADGGGLVVGHTAQLTVAGVVPELQVLGTTTGVDGSMALVTASTTNAAQSQIILGKVGNAALGSFTTVAQDEALGAITWVGDDGVDLATVAARIAAVVNGAGTVAASRVPTDLVFYTDPGGGDDAVREGMRLGLGAAGGGGVLFIGNGTTKTHAGVTGPGVVINQVTNDGLAIVLQSSTDVATGLTTIVPGTADTADYFSIQKFADTTGGAIVTAYGENAAVTTNFRIESYGGQASTTHTSAGRSLMEVAVHQHDGANALATVTNDGNVFGIRANSGGTETTVWLVDEDGAPQSIVDHAAFDLYDDVGLIRALDCARSRTLPEYGYVKSRWDDYLQANEASLVEMGILGCPMPRAEGDPRPLLNMKRLAMLQNGAIFQLFEMVMGVAQALPLAAREALPERVRKMLATAAAPSSSEQKGG